MIVSLIAAVAQNGVIGRNNTLPWRLSADMRHFVDTTRGHVVITGRKNYDAMGRALPKRRNLVVSRDPSWTSPDAEVVPTLERALQMADDGGEQEAFVIGGGQIYELALPYALRIYRTLLDIAVEGDVFFPTFEAAAFERRELFRHEADDKNECGFTVELFTRRAAPRSFR